jgi:superfamily II DNA or RNA helicase
MQAFPEPRKFQHEAHKNLQVSAKEHRRQVIMAPTGAGKTYLALRIINEALKRGKRAIFICDRITLIDQTGTVAYKYGMPEFGVIQADHYLTNPKLPFQIASAQTLAARGWGQEEYDVIVIDECHTQHTVWTEYIKTCNAFCIGLSATPFAKGLGLLFSNLINAATMHDLVEQGVLVPMKVFSCTRIDMKGAATIGGEWSAHAAEERGMDIIGNVVLDWQKFGNNEKTIIFGATIKHCEDMARQFNNASINAAVFTSDTKPEDRKIILDEFRKPDSKIRVLLSVEALSKGFDVPDIGCIADCRPLRKSLSTAIQMWGRGLRSHPGKTECRLLDFSGNIIRFQEDFTEIYFNGLSALDSGEKLDKSIRKDSDEKEKSCCPKCGNTPFFKRCMSCGYEKRAMSTIEHLPGEMKEIELCKKYKAENTRDLYNQIASYIRKGRTREEKKAGYTAITYKNITGEWPNYNYHLAPTVSVSKAVSGKIKASHIAWSKGKNKEATQ